MYCIAPPWWTYKGTRASHTPMQQKQTLGEILHLQNKAKHVLLTPLWELWSPVYFWQSWNNVTI
jgi:hypothetical protein